MLTRNAAALLALLALCLLPIFTMHESDGAVSAQEGQASDETMSSVLTIADASTPEKPLFECAGGSHTIGLSNCLALLAEAIGEQIFVSQSGIAQVDAIKLICHAPRGGVAIDAWSLVDNALQGERLFLTRVGGSLSVQQAMEAIRLAPHCESRAELETKRDLECIRMLVRLKHADAAKIQGTLQKHITPKSAAINPLEEGLNALMIVDCARNLREVLALIDELDRAPIERKLRSVRVGEDYAKPFAGLAETLYGVKGLVDSECQRFFWTEPLDADDAMLKNIAALRDECEKEE